jgi:hypothetical protein
VNISTYRIEQNTGNDISKQPKCPTNASYHRNPSPCGNWSIPINIKTGKGSSISLPFPSPMVSFWGKNHYNTLFFHNQEKSPKIIPFFNV